MYYKKLFTNLAAAGIVYIVTASSVAAQDAKSAMALYTAKQYGPAADAFEKVIAKAPSANACYYAALACQAAHRDLRARQLFEFVATTYPRTTEGIYAKQALANMPQTTAHPAGTSASASSSSDSSELPDSVKALLPPGMLAMIKTPEGKRAVMDVMKMNAEKIDTIRRAETAGAINPQKVKANVKVPGFAGVGDANKGSGTKEFPFTASDIAKDGSRAIDQMYYPNCWFECSMAALADLPRGQKLIASMIRGRAEDTYVVRFPGDGVEYVITTDDLMKEGIHDSGLWASLIEAAQTRKFPHDNGNSVDAGLTTLAGAKAEVLSNLREVGAGEISSFIGGAVSSKNPIVCGTYPAAYMSGMPLLVFPSHAYTIIGFEPSKNMITIRNPHGKNSRRFNVSGDPNHLDFEQLDDGIFRMSIRLFQKYFYSAARAFI